MNRVELCLVAIVILLNACSTNTEVAKKQSYSLRRHFDEVSKDILMNRLVNMTVINGFMLIVVNMSVNS